MIKTHIPARPRNKKIVPTGGSSIAPIVSSGGSSHSHSNKSVIDKLTQGNIDVLSYLSLYQTGVEQTQLLDDFGDPVFDLNGDPVMIDVLVPVLDSFGNPVLDEYGDPVTETVPIFAIKSTAAFFSEEEVSAYGLGGEGSGGGGGGYDMLLGWVDYTEEKSNWVISAALGKGLHDRVTMLEAGGVGGSVAWADITGKPSTFTPSSHSHGWSEITGKPSTFTPSSHSHGWSEITGKPSTFTPSAHTHSAGDITSGTFSIARIPTGTTGTTVALGNHLHTGVYEPVFSKNTAFNKDFGTTSGTVAEGNDSRIVNGQTAYSWGNHASAGYALSSALANYVTLDTTQTISGAKTFSAALTASTSVTTPKIIFAAAGWELVQYGTELQMQYNSTAKLRFTSTGAIVATNEITAFG